MSENLPERLRNLYQKASSARERSYSPYSGRKVGAALKTTSGNVYVGCNIENSSFGATACAEQVAIQKAISEEGKIKIQELLVVTDAEPAWPPCGICRQVIAEFAQGDIEIHGVNLKQDSWTKRLSEIFPSGFTPEHMK